MKIAKLIVEKSPCNNKIILTLLKKVLVLIV